MNYQLNKPIKEKAPWSTQIGRLKRTYLELTNPDLNYEENKSEEMIASLVKKLGIDEVEIREVMNKSALTS